jgi:hypothetical protein
VRRGAAWGVLVVTAGTLAVGCSASETTNTQASCGATRTGADVPVIIEVTKGNVSCPAALSVERAYAADIRKGDLKGNGGGAPIQVNGWSCQGYSTPKVLSTGDASECHSGSSEILAVLDVPSSNPTSSR